MKLNNIKKKIKSKKGASMVEFTIVMMLFVTVFSIGFDFIMLGYKYMSVSNYANDLVRTLSVQGGVESSTPNGFQGGDSAYKTISEIKSEKDRFAKSIGSKSDEVDVLVVYYDNLNVRHEKKIDSMTSFNVEYLTPFEIIIEYTPKLEILSNFNVKLTNKMRRVKMGVSEYVKNY